MAVSKQSESRMTAFIIITFLFFLWGAITSVNDVLVDYYKKLHALSELKSMLILFAFFGAYGLGALAYYLYSQANGDPINKMGYKKGMLLGLIVAGLGCISLYPITALGNYYIVLISFFIIGLGLTLLQISCNPYIAILGPSESASSRLNLSQGFNSLGTTIGPLIVGFLLLSYLSKENAIQNIYLFNGLLFFAFALILWRVKLPDYQSDEQVKLSGNAFNFSHLRAGMVAIFFYVGAEVMIGGKLMEYVQLPEIGNLSRTDAASYLGIYWGGAMIGRLAISVISSQKYSALKRALYGFLTIAFVYASIVLFITIKEKVLELGLPFNYNTYALTFSEITPILWFVLIQYLGMLWFQNSSKGLLSLFSAIITICLALAFIFEGKTALWCMLSIGLFNSILWSNIFTLSIANLKEYTSQASSLLVIMIVGGAFLPLIMGWISDISGSLKVAYLLPIISYLYLIYFGLQGSKIKDKI